MKLISNELRQIELALRSNKTDEEKIKSLLKAHIDEITLEEITEVIRFQREFENKFDTKK